MWLHRICSFYYPIFRYLLSGVSFSVLLMCQVFFGVLLAMIAGAGTATLAELFPTSVRSSWLAAIYSTSVAFAGGFAPFIAVLMIQQ